MQLSSGVVLLYSILNFHRLSRLLSSPTGPVPDQYAVADQQAQWHGQIHQKFVDNLSATPGAPGRDELSRLTSIKLAAQALQVHLRIMLVSTNCYLPCKLQHPSQHQQQDDIAQGSVIYPSAFSSLSFQ